MGLLASAAVVLLDYGFAEAWSAGRTWSRSKILCEFLFTRGSMLSSVPKRGVVGLR